MILDISEIQDIQNLIDSGIKESLTLEYKKELGKNKEIAIDISAFANTSGGVIVYGVEEERGIPISLSWINNKGIKERIENVILSNIQPKLEGYKIKQIDNPSNREKSVFVVTIPESINVPHMANYRYYKRHHFKSEPMDDYEVKDAIFKKGLREALLEEINYNIDLAGKTLKKIEEIFVYNPKERQFIAFVPFRVEAWRSVVSSGLFSLIEEKIKDLIIAYNLIYEINYFVELQKYGIKTVVTQTDTAKPKYGTYIPFLIREKVSKMLGLLSQVKTIQQEKGNKD